LQVVPEGIAFTEEMGINIAFIKRGEIMEKSQNERLFP
jgi:hypothetical protein